LECVDGLKEALLGGSVLREIRFSKFFEKRMLVFFFRGFEILPTIFWMEMTERMEYVVPLAMD
jgi:hypothetical protein